MDIIRQLDEVPWREFVDNHPQSQIFHTPEMFQVFRRTKGHHPELWAATQDGRVMALLLPVRVTLMGGLLRPFTTRAVVYGSVLCAPGPGGREALEMLLQTYRRETKSSI
jgi:serine/alanine adding enzyme